MRRHGRLAQVLYALWFTPIVPLVLLGRAAGRGRGRVLLALLAGAVAWGAGEAALLLSPLAWDRLALLHFLWSAAGGAACAGARRRLAPERADAAPPSAAHGLTPGPIVGCGVLFYLVALTDVALVSIFARTVDPSARRMLSPLVLLWASPGLPLGMALGALWQRRLGEASVEAVATFFVGLHLLLLGTAALLATDMWATLRLNPPNHLRLHPHQMTAAYAALASAFAPLVVYGYFVSLAPRGRGAVARIAACLGLFLASLVQIEMATGTVALLHRQRALRDERADDGVTARRAVDDWHHYLATFPESDERAEVLWRVATTLVRVGEHARAHDAFARLASLPDDVPGQRWVRQARAVLARFTDTPGEARADTASAPLIEYADYLSNDWRGVLSFLGSGQEVAREEFLGRLRLISLERDRIVLPPVTSLFEVKAYGRLLGLEVAVRPLTLEEVKAELAAGRPVLVQRQDRWLCLVGADARWGTFLYYDYERETERLRRAHSQAEAQALFEEGGAGSRARLGVLRGNLLEDIPADDIAQAVADRQGLAATLGPPAGDGNVAWDEFLLGELAYQAGDAVAALDHYASAASGLGGVSWPLLYVHVAARAGAEPPREIVQRRLLPAANADALAEWQRETGHAALLARARAEFERHDLATLPTPVLERLGALLRRDPAADASLLARCYETLRARYPEHGPYLTALAEAYRRSGALAPLAAVERDQATLEPANADHLLDLAETLLGLDRPGDTRAALERVRELGGWRTPRYLALAGRAALARGEHRGAVGLLGRALDANHADPELRADLALALEGIGERERALAEWRWVELAAVDPRHRELARERLAGQEPGR